jgi:exopolysaccharide biosynthesis polyprenyl glycosylphosphotransferase
MVMLADLVTVAAAMGLAYALLHVVPGTESPDLARHQYALLGALALPVWIGLFFHYHLYSARHVASPVEEIGRIIHAAGAAVIVVASAGFMLKFFVSRAWLVLWFVCAVVLVGLERAVVRRMFKLLRVRGRMLRSVVIVGWNREGSAISDMLADDPGLGYRVVGVVDDWSGHRAIGPDGPTVIGPIEETLDIVRRTGAGGVIVATTGIDFAVVNRLIRQLSEEGIHVELSSSLRDIAAKRLTVRSLGRFPVVYVEPVQRHGWRARAKRAFDFVGATSGMLVLSPLLTGIALAVKLTSRGPVLFRQQRVGEDGTTFEMLKFRTMVVRAEERIVELHEHNEASGPLFKIRNDPRVTRVGRFLRRFSLDELPQLWNVVRGRMSLVGPRPALPSEVSFWSSELHQRLTVKPGITGMWQISGRSNVSFEEYSRLDLYYVDNWSLWTDLAILLKTVPAVMSRRGAY